MTWQIVISSLVLSLILLVPLGIKWEISIKTTVLGSMMIGILTGLIVRSIVEIYDIKFYQVLVLELFLIMGISASLLLWRFYRDPERVPPEIENAVLSPADGKIIYVKKIERGEIPFCEKKGSKFLLSDFIKTDVIPLGGYVIGMSMNFLDVHVNRAPISGKITLVKHIKGSFISLKRKEAVIQNERVLTIIDNGHFKVGVVQIASRLVRRIVTYLQEGHEIKRGERIGAIRFGSQVDLILNDIPFLHIEVRPGEEVKAGITVVARILENQREK